MIDRTPRFRVALLAACAVALPAGAQTDGSAADESFLKPKLSGYVRQYVGVNLRDHQATGAGVFAPQEGRFETNCAPGVTCADYDDAGKLSMLRTQLRLNFGIGPENARVSGIVRAVYEHKTGFLRELERRGAKRDFVDDQLNVSELRELFIDLAPSRDLSFRLGKQQIVWEEADAPILDTIHGLDIRWRGFGELGESEEFRKPLIAALATWNLPAVEGKVDVFVRPGLDRDRDIGASPDNYGGRWTFNFAEGVDNSASFVSDPDNPKGKFDKPTGGVRWSQRLGDTSYSVMAFTTFSDPAINPCSSYRPPVPALGGATLGQLGAQSYGRAARCGAGGGGIIGDQVLKIVPVFGATANTSIDALGAILTGVVAYVPGTPFTRGAVPIIRGVKEKDVFKWSARIERPVDLSLLGAWRQSAFSLQFTGTHISGIRSEEGLVQNFVFPAPLRKEAYGVSFRVDLPYQNDKFIASVIGVYDLSYGGGTLSPQIDYSAGNNWRVKLQYDRFSAPHARIAPAANAANLARTDANIGSAFKDKDQLTLRVTYQF